MLKKTSARKRVQTLGLFLGALAMFAAAAFSGYLVTRHYRNKLEGAFRGALNDLYGYISELEQTLENGLR